MSESTLYNPFKDFHFDNETCFLSGRPLQSTDERIPVFPRWLMRKFDLADKPFKMLDESIRTYKELQLPCTMAVREQVSALEARVEDAFHRGYEAVVEMEETALFQWVAKKVYGIVFNEIQIGMRQQALTGEAMNFSQVLTHKFRNLHLMLQSLVVPMRFEGGMPFTVEVVPVANPENTFSYRDEINTLVYSLRMNDFGLIVCLQDNGTNGVYHQKYMEAVGAPHLHPIQFEELCARFFYSAYLFNRLPEYVVSPTAEMTYVEPMPLMDMSMKPIFDPWQTKTYGQVLEQFWKPWGYTLFEIIKDPENPMSFLLDDQGEPRPPHGITLPKG